MDNLKIKIAEAPDDIMQSRFNYGWKSNHFVTSVLCFTPDGSIPACFDNLPRCSHDSTIADWDGLYHKLKQVYKDSGLKFVIDPAFCSAKIDVLIKSSQDDLTASAGATTTQQ